MSRGRLIFALILVVVVVGFGYTNCGINKTGLYFSMPSVTDNDLTSQSPAYTKVKLGDRTFVYQTFSTVFGTDGSVAGDYILASSLKKLLVVQDEGSISGTGLGGPCDPYGNSFRCTPAQRKTDSLVPVMPVSAATREGIRLRACEEATNLDLAIRTAVQRIGVATINTPATATSAREALAAFYGDAEFPDSVVEALLEIQADAQSKGYPQIDAWRFIFYAICSTPSWQQY